MYVHLHLHKIYEALCTSFVCPRKCLGFGLLACNHFCMQRIDKVCYVSFVVCVSCCCCWQIVISSALCCHLMAFGQFRSIALLFCCFIALLLYCFIVHFLFYSLLSIHEIRFTKFFVYYLRFGSIAFALIYHHHLTTEINQSL